MSGSSKSSMAMRMITLFCIFILSPVVITSATVQDENKPINVDTLNIDYMNKYYQQVSFIAPQISVLRVNDLRNPDSVDVDPSFAGVMEGGKDLYLDVTVKEFIERSFMQMLIGDENTERQLEVELNVEEFSLEQKKISLLSNKIGFDGRISITVIYDNKRIKAGYLQYYPDAAVPSNVKENLAKLMYQGMTAMAQQLAHRINVAEIEPRGDLDIYEKPAEEREIQAFAPIGEAFSIFTSHFKVFTEDLMKDSYGSMVCGGLYGGHWFENRMGYWLSLTGGKTTGTPVRANESWNVTSSELKMYITSIGGTFLYSLRKDPTKSIFNPFVGVGLEGFVGVEKLSATATRTSLGFEGHIWGIRGLFATHVLVGSRFRVTENARLLVEGRWTQSGKGGNADLKTEEEMEILDVTLYDAVQRSDFDFTGWSVHVGLEW